MMTGEFQTISPESVIVGDRVRENLTAIEELAESIKRSGGLMHPIVLTRDLTLVAGERRLEACKLLGFTAIPFQFTDEVDPAELKVLELMENLQRVDIPWQNNAKSIEELHKIKKAGDSHWTNEKTGSLIGVTKNTVTRYLTAAKEINNPLVAGATSERSAYNIATRIQERRRFDETIHTDSNGILINTPFLNQPFQTWARTYSGPKFNLIHCDLPYGINADKAQQGTAAKFAGYSDTAEVYWDLLNSLSVDLDNFCAESAHMIFWFSMNHYQNTWELLKLLDGFVFDPFPLIWLKSDNIGFLPDPERGPRRIYETAFFGRRGDRKILRAKSNAFTHPTTMEVHTHEKPVAVLTHFMEMLVDENTAILDPTCGGGSAIRAARLLGAKRFLGLDTNSEHVAAANRKFAE
jgi:ParB family chromosome partitioning protein